MSAIEASSTQPAFTSAPIASWTSTTTKHSPARNVKTLRPSRRSKGVFAPPPHTRRTPHHQRSPDPFLFTSQPSTLNPTRVVKSPGHPQPKHRRTLVPNAQPENLPDELVRQLLGNESRLKSAEENGTQHPTLRHLGRPEDLALYADETKTGTNLVTKAALSQQDLALRKRQKEEKLQKAYLTEQLEKRHLENLEKKVTNQRNKSKHHKRARPSSRSRPSASTAFKDSFQAYMTEISREELLGHAEIFTLANRIRESLKIERERQSLRTELGRLPTIPELAEKLAIMPKEVQKRLMAGTAAKNALVSANLRLVTSVARKISFRKGVKNPGLALDDMIQEGSVGLIRAAEKFDATRGYKFSTYATWWIRAYVMRSISTQSRSIKVPSTIVDEYARIKKESSRLREIGNFKPRDCDVARALGITPAKLRFVVNVVTRVPTSLDVTLNPTGNSKNSRSLGEVVAGDDHIEERMVEELARKELDEALRSCLKPLERAVIKLRFGLEDGQSRTLRETGALLGLSKERIRQIIFRALPKMKTPEIQRMLTDATTR